MQELKLIFTEVDSLPPISYLRNNKLVSYRPQTFYRDKAKALELLEFKLRQDAVKHNFKMNNPQQEQFFINVLTPRFIKERVDVKALVLSTCGPVNLFPDGSLGYIDDQVIKMAVNNSSSVTMVQGCMVNEEKQTAKLVGFLSRYPTIKGELEIITPGSICRRLDKWGRDEPLKVIIKMSGEWSDYLREFVSLHYSGYRNFVIYLMRNHTSNKFVLQIYDFRGEYLTIEQLPFIKENSRERKWFNDNRTGCPYCLAPGKDTKPMVKKGKRLGEHMCSKCRTKWKIVNGKLVPYGSDFRLHIRWIENGKILHEE